MKEVIGIGGKLVALAIEALEKEGINKVLLVAFKKNEGGNAFWESQGFSPYSIMWCLDVCALYAPRPSNVIPQFGHTYSFV